jgi:GAF domain-containing protein
MSVGDSTGPTAATAEREQALAGLFVRLADTLVDDYDVVSLLDDLVQAAVRLLDVTAAGLLLDDQQGHLALVASSSEETRLLEIFQLQNDEGPCLDCVRRRTVVSSHDLAADISRWPVFVPEALNAGFRAVTAVPLRLRDEVIGGLNMFIDTARRLGERDVQVAQALADVATIGILQQRAAHRTSILAEQLQHALNSRVAIEQAKGILAERNNVGMDAAFAALVRHARDRNLKLSAVAAGVVRGSVHVTVEPPAPS